MNKELTKKDIKEVFLEALEPFAQSTQSEFARIDKRFENIDKRFDGVDKRFDGIDKRFDGVESELREVKQDVKEMKENSSALFVKLDEFIGLYKKQEQEMLALGSRLQRLEERIDKLELVS